MDNNKIGILILPPKVGDADHYLELARKAGREQDVIRVAPDQPWVFNAIDYEIHSPGGSVASAAHLIRDLGEVAARADAMKSTDPFWHIEGATLNHMAMICLHRAWRHLGPQSLYDFIGELPNSPEDLKSESWLSGFCYRTLRQAVENAGDDPDLELAADYVLCHWTRMSDKTASSIVAHAKQAVSHLMHGDVRRLVAGGSNCGPDDLLQRGKVVIVDTPPLKYREPGALVQVAWKLATQRAVLRRDVRENPRPVAIVADEAQLTAVPRSDNQVTAVGRSHRLAQFNLTQSLDLIQTVFGKKEEVLSFVSNHSSKLIFSNSDPFTLTWASQLSGQSRTLMMSGGSPDREYSAVDEFLGRPPAGNFGFSESVQPNLRPEFFSSGMRKGGVENALTVDAVFVQGGRTFSGKPYLLTSFKQGV